MCRGMEPALAIQCPFCLREVVGMDPRSVVCVCIPCHSVMDSGSVLCGSRVGVL